MEWKAMFNYYLETLMAIMALKMHNCEVASTKLLISNGGYSLVDKVITYKSGCFFFGNAIGWWRLRKLKQMNYRSSYNGKDLHQSSQTIYACLNLLSQKFWPHNYEVATTFKL